MITEDYVSFETAKLLKEKGFNEICEMFYCKPHEGYLRNLKRNEWWNSNLREDMTCTCPTLQMTMKWLREVHGLFIFISPWIMLENSIQYYFEIREIKTHDFKTLYDYTSKELNSFEKVIEEAIKYCLENLI